jgi:hypothetical protein
MDKVQTPFKRHKNIFAVCLERASKAQDMYKNHTGSKIFISK